MLDLHKSVKIRGNFTFQAVKCIPWYSLENLRGHAGIPHSLNLRLHLMMHVGKESNAQANARRTHEVRLKSVYLGHI